MFETYESVHAGHPRLVELRRQLEANQKRVDKATLPPADFVKAIKDHTSRRTSDSAADFKLALNHVKAQRQLVDFFAEQMGNAKDEIDNALAAIDNAKLKDQAAELRKEGEAHEKMINGIISTVVHYTKAVVITAAEGPVGAIELLEVVHDLHTMFEENDLVAEADRLEALARGAELEAARKAFDQAGKHLAAAQGFLKQAEEISAEFEDDVDHFRAVTEADFKASGGGHFSFDDLTKGIDLADRTHALAKKLVPLAALAKADATHAIEFVIGTYREPLLNGPSMKVAEAMRAEVEASGKHAQAALERAQALRTSLRATRAKADEALVMANDPRAKGQGKK
jgi:hypothetical protein